MKPTVSIKKCPNYEPEEVYNNIKEAVDLLGGMSKFVKPGERILLKPNLLAGREPEKAVTTHPAVVRAAILLVKEAGGVPIVGDSSARGGTEKSARVAGLIEVTDSLGVEFVDLKTLVNIENPDGLIFKRLQVAKEVLEVDGVINLPKLKTHVQMYLTLGVKNIFG
ncbi:MAG: DUF362 domain-containing protein, partial [Thermodesulfobacteriota bacterium]